MHSTHPARTPPAAPEIRPGYIALLLATRGRPELLTEAFTSLKVNTVKKELVSFWIYVDDDDQVTQQAIAGGKLPDPGFPVHWHIGPQTGGLGQCHQALWKASDRTAQVYVTTVDDARFDTPGWDEIVRAKYNEYPDGVLLAFPHDPMTADLATYPIFGWNWIKTMGHIYSGYFPYWFEDNWVDQIGRMVDRCVKLPFAIRPISGGKGRTKRMRNHAFWMRFFQLTLDERKESARKLIAAMYPENDTKRAAAIARLEEVAREMARESEGFSDIYCVFQEERHTELTADERLRFDARYFKHEALIVGRLMSRARELVEKKQFAAAFELLDVMQFSDIRLRQAQALMAECLGALGRSAEAKRMDRENLAVWPQMNVLRRCFRFLGMVANDGKRLLVGFTEKGKTGQNPPTGGEKAAKGLSPH